MRVILFLCKILLAASVQAHEINPVVIDLNPDGRIEVRFNLEPILANIDLSTVENTDDDPNAGVYDELRALSDDQLALRFEAAEPSILEALGIQGEWSQASLQIEPQPDFELPRDAVLTGTLAPPSPWIWQAPASTGEIVIRQNDENGYTALLAPGQASARLDQAVSAGTQFQIYLISGIEHIIPKGLDHILFVMGLFLFSAAWKPLLAQVTVFTAAHTLTLALASMQIVVISASIVEPLIALSIAYVAFENLMRRPPLSRRLVLVLAFGLLHGLGFASVLQEFGLGGEHFALSLAAFNIGVEIGQLLVLAPMYLLLGTWACHQSWYRGAIKIPLSVAIGAVGLYWTFERVLG